MKLFAPVSNIKTPELSEIGKLAVTSEHVEICSARDVGNSSWHCALDKCMVN
jgi:hypothetical protein